MGKETPSNLSRRALLSSRISTATHEKKKALKNPYLEWLVTNILCDQRLSRTLAKIIDLNGLENMDTDVRV